MLDSAIYGFYREARYDRPVNVGQVTQFGPYDPLTMLQGYFSDYLIAGLSEYVKEIPDDRYTGTLPDGITPSGKRMLTLRYDSSRLDEAPLRESFDAALKSMMGRAITGDEALAFVRGSTSLEEVESGRFLVCPAGEGIMGPTEAVYLVIN